MSKKLFWLSLAVTALVALTGAFLTNAMLRGSALSEHLERSHWLAANLQSQCFKRHQGRMQQIALIDIMAKTIQGQAPVDNTEIRSILETMRHSMDGELAYLLNHKGTVVASARYEGNKSLTCNNYAFRPYFSDAMWGTPVAYLALGVTTGKRGIYISVPVTDDEGKSLGVLVLKTGLTQVDSILSDEHEPAALLSPDGVIFAANRPDWLFRLSRPIDRETSDRIRRDRQFGWPLEPLPAGLRLDGDTFSIDDTEFNGVRVPLAIYDNEGHPWQIFSARRRYEAVPNWLLLSVLVLPFLIRTALVNWLLRLSERRQSAKAFRESEERYRHSFEINSAIKLLIDADSGAIVDANQAAVDFYGYPRDRLLDMRIFDINCMPEDRIRAEMAAAAVQNRLYFRFCHRLASGEIRDVEVYSGPITIGGKRYLHSIIHDVTERRRAEEKLVRAHKAAEAANQAKSTFLANMSHELRTPLNAMLGHAQMLERDPELSQHQRRSVETIRRSGDYLLALINDVLDLAKIESGRFKTVVGPCDLPVLFESILSLLRPRAKDKKVALSYYASPTVPNLVKTDENRLQQIAMNLLGNAIKFTEEGSVRLETDYRDGSLTLCVVDTGIGIDPKEMDALFRPFHQGSGELNRNQGTGLGLALTKRLVEQMNGRIDVESKPGKGSIFRVQLRLPVLAEEAPVGERGTQSQHVLGYRRRDEILRPYRILIVDDAADNRDMLADMLQMLGFETALADSGKAGVRMALEQHPDLVLMDLVMPGIDGLEATGQIHSVPTAAEIPVVACSANACADDRESSLAAGCVEHLAKPVRIEELIAVLGRHLVLEWTHRDDVHRGEPLDPKLRERLLALAKRGRILDIRGLLAERFTGQLAGIEAELLEAANRFDLKQIRKLLDE